MGQPPFFRISRCIYKNLLIGCQVASAELGIDTAFVGMDTAKRASSLDIAKWKQRWFLCAQLPELDMDFPEEKEVYQALAFYEKEYTFLWLRNTANCVLYVGMKTVWMCSRRLQSSNDPVCRRTIRIAQEDVICLVMAKTIVKCWLPSVAMGNAVPEIQQVADMDR